MNYYEHNSRGTSWEVLEMDEAIPPYEVEERQLTQRERDDFRLLLEPFFARQVHND